MTTIFDPYNAGEWGSLPVVCFGYEPSRQEAYLADRSFRPLTVSTDTLDAARARVK
jgi:hypothetical protein